MVDLFCTSSFHVSCEVLNVENPMQYFKGIQEKAYQQTDSAPLKLRMGSANQCLTFIGEITGAFSFHCATATSVVLSR